MLTQEHKFNSHLFKKIIDNIAEKNRFSLEPLYSFDDIKQELWEKIYKLYLNDKDPFKTLPEIEQIKSATTVLKRRVVDMKRSKFRTPDHLMKPLSVDDSFEDFCESYNPSMASNESGADEFAEILNGISSKFIAAENNLMYQELNGLIFNWIESQPDKITKQLMKEKFRPSKETNDKWEQLCEKHPRYRGCDLIPGITLCDILGIKRSYWYNAIESLKDYLKQYSYYEKRV